MADLKDRERGVEAQQDFGTAENANVIQQAGEGLDALRNNTPVPRERLTTSEVQTEAGRSPGQNKTETRGAGDQTESQVKAEEREALRRQGPHDTDTDMDPEGRPEGELAAIDPIISANPD